ncbi:tetratricopeptide repeat protein [Terrimonas pollutisoli]|uniref:tetratricopeptide repeat protein n=1 Tax=Terrimonas pollutisoli TaxID=3034147 RepID=UPI0023EADDC6|nr:tetratricopeptide repeat protein [Terrimonas sp. H1YJ31]
MKKKYFFIIIIGLFVVAAGFLAIEHKKKHKVKGDIVVFYPLKERPGYKKQSAEEKKQQENFANLMKVVRTNPSDTKSRIALAGLYINEARITGDYDYYNGAAMKYVDEVLEIDSLHFEALTYKSLLYLSQHHFEEGLSLAEKARALVPENAFAHGILVDANVEMGKYEKAVEEADKMISIRPDLRSYSRVSYLREIHGDYPGAIDAMKLAVDAGYPGDEATEWSRVRLGYLYETIGDLKSAEMHYLIALQRRPAYAYAIAGLGRIAIASNEFSEAVHYFMQADSLVIDNSIKEELASAYLFAGQKKKADSILHALLDDMNEHGEEGHHQNLSHHADKELAHLYMKAGDYDEALEHALKEYRRRPANIDVNETVAWAYYLKRDYNEAIPYILAAMKTNSKKPALLCRAGLIYARTNEKTKAKRFLEASMINDFTIDQCLKEEAINTLATL